MRNGFVSSKAIQLVQDSVVPSIAVTECDGVNIKAAHGGSFIVAIGTITATAVITVHAQVSDDDITYNDLEGTSLSIPDSASNLLFVLEVTGIVDKWIRPVVSVSVANAGITNVMAITTLTDVMPPVQGATVGDTLIVNAPAQGTP